MFKNFSVYVSSFALRLPYWALGPIPVSHSIPRASRFLLFYQGVLSLGVLEFIVPFYCLFIVLSGINHVRFHFLHRFRSLY